MKSTAEPGETIWQVARRQGIEIPHLCYALSRATVPTATAAPAWSRCKESAYSPLRASASRRRGCRSRSASSRAVSARGGWSSSCLVADQPPRASAHDPDSKFWQWADRGRCGVEPVPRAARAAARPHASGDGGPARRLHPLHALRPCLPRGPGQRRHRHGRPRRPREDRLRLRRPDGPEHLRRVRRVRPGLPDRCLDAASAASTSAG